MKRTHVTAAGLLLMALAASSCIALDWHFEGAAASSGGSATASSTGAGGATSATTGSGGGATGSGGGATSSGVTGTGGAPTACVPGAPASCYSGPPSTENVGACHSGTATCLDDGSGLGPCNGEATPKLLDCKPSTDENCDGLADSADPLCATKLTGAHVWSKVFPAQNDQLGTSVAVDSAGNVVIAGIFQDTVNFGGGALVSAGANDIFVAKFSPSGQLLWSQRFGGPTNEGERGVRVGLDGAGNVLLTGMFETGSDFGGGPLVVLSKNEVFILKLDPSGTPLWCKTFGAPSLSTESLAVSASGNVAVTGYFGGTVDLAGAVLTSAGSNDIFVAELGPSGAPIWGRAFGDVGADNGASIAFTPAGNVFVTGYFSGTVGFGPVPLTSAGLGDIFVAKLDLTGTTLWSKRFGDASFQGDVTLAVDGLADVFLLGRLNGTVDFGAGPLTGVTKKDIFLAKLDPSGVPLWSKAFNGTSSLIGAGIAADSSGNVVMTGQVSGSVDLGSGPLPAAGGNDIFVAKLSPTGKTIWSKRFGDAANEEGTSVAVDSSANVLVLSYGGGTIDFGGGILVSGGGGDPFLTKLAP